MGEKVPYKDGMQLGQGYNTYLQQPCVRDAVAIENSSDHGPPFTREYRSTLVESYEKLAKSLKISAGAAVSGWGQSSQVDVSFLERSEFENSTLTYQVEVLVQHQGNISNKFRFNKISANDLTATYGDRFISDFVRGGHFLARVSITAKNASQKQELQQSSETAFTMYGVEGKVTQEVQNAVESIQRNAITKITIYESTGTTPTSEASYAKSESSDLLQIKEKADKFYADASSGVHNYLLFAVLGRYINLADFEDYFAPMTYASASERSWALFDAFTRYQGILTVIRAVPKNKFAGGSSEYDKLLGKGFENSQAIRDKVLSISQSPGQAIEVDSGAPDRFYLQVLRSIQSKAYVAQSIPFDSSGNWTDVVLSSIKSDGTKLFDFSAYDFPDIIGTEVVSFGKARNGNQRICLIGERASNIDGWTEESHFWIFPTQIETFVDQPVVVSRSATQNVIRLKLGDQSDINQPSRYQLFYFFS